MGVFRYLFNIMRKTDTPKNAIDKQPLPFRPDIEQATNRQKPPFLAIATIATMAAILTIAEI